MWFKKKRTPEKRELLTIIIKNGQLSTIENFNSFQTRAESSIKMLMDTFKLGISNQELYFNIHTGDFPSEGIIQPNNFYYCCDRKENLSNVFPDFIFDHWKQAGIETYHETVDSIVKASTIPFKHGRMLWIGNVQTNPVRSKIIAYSNEYPELIEAYDTCVDQFVNGNKKAPYVSLPDHTKYKYLIDIEGRGFSGRLKLLLHTKRLLFIQERKWKSYYHFDLEPYVHFIPVKNDLSDLIPQIQLVEKEGASYYQMITNNAYEFASANLTYERAIQRIQKLLNNQ